MGLYGIMRTGVSGMNAQSSKLGTVADNIANVNTTGYKRGSSEFSSLITPGNTGTYNSGSVQAYTRYAISEQGALSFTTSGSDLAIDGNGFMIVADRDGNTALTRAGNFVPDGNGYLVNTAGYLLQGYPLTNGDPSVVANSLTGLEPVNLDAMSLRAVPSTAGTLVVNLDSNASNITAGPPTTYTAKTSLVTYDHLGNEAIIDVYFSRLSGEPDAMGVIPETSEWEITILGAEDSPVTEIFIFDNTTGNLTDTSATWITLEVLNGEPLTLDLTGTTQLAAEFSVGEAVVNGSAPQAVDHVEIAEDGTLYSVYPDGTRTASYRIPLANVASPDNLTPMAGNIFQPNQDSGDVMVGFPGEDGFGDLYSGALELSNVDLASELTSMIESQRSFSANSKVFQAGSNLLEELVNMVR